MWPELYFSYCKKIVTTYRSDYGILCQNVCVRWDIANGRKEKRHRPEALQERKRQRRGRHKKEY